MRNDSDCCRTWLTELLAVLGGFDVLAHPLDRERSSFLTALELFRSDGVRCPYGE
jgi:hypothetical protein